MNVEKTETVADSAERQETADGKLTVYLTDRAPVRIAEANWPIVALAELPIFRVSQKMADRTLHEAITHTLADADYDLIPELDRDVELMLWIEVTIRKHVDGRCLLYGIRRGVDGSSDIPADSLREKRGRIRESCGEEPRGRAGRPVPRRRINYLLFLTKQVDS